MCCHTTLYAKEKSDKLKPKWVTHALPESKSGTYFFVKSMGMGATLAGAKQQAFVSMAQMLEQERGLTVNTSVQVMEKITQNQYEHNAEYTQEIEMEVIEKGHQLKIVCREIDDYSAKVTSMLVQRIWFAKPVMVNEVAGVVNVIVVFVVPEPFTV
jgi:hypothetical protein